MRLLRSWLRSAPVWVLVSTLWAEPRTILFVDDHDVLYRAGTRRVLHPATRHPSNPVLGEEKPWELALAWVSVYRDPRTGKYQMWYQAYSRPVTKHKTHQSVVSYAESDDG